MPASRRDEAGVRILAWRLTSNRVHVVAFSEAEDSPTVMLRRVLGRCA